MPGIQRQSDYYGFIPEVAQRSAAREAEAAFDLPSDEDASGLLAGPSITAGMNDRRRLHVAADPFVQEVFARIHVRPSSSGGYAWDSVVEDKSGDAIERSYGSEGSYEQAYQKATAHITKVFGELTQNSTGLSPWDMNGPTYASNGRDADFSRGPAASRAVLADHGDMALLDGIATENGWAVESSSDPGGVQRSLYRDGTEYVIGVRWKKFSPDVVESANLSTQDPLGWPRDALGETTNLNVVKDWLQHSFLDEPIDDGW